MTRKAQVNRQRAHAIDGRGVFNYAWNRRYSGVEMAPNSWLITEERRENGEWVLYRYCNEFGHFDSIQSASARAIEEAINRRSELQAAKTRDGWQKMTYPAEFADFNLRAQLPGRLPVEWDITLDARMAGPEGSQREIKHPLFVREDGLRVEMRVRQLADGKWWLVCSASYSDETPDWDTMCEVKDLFIGKARHALQVHPRESEYVNISIHMLHMFVPLNGWTLPDFRPLL